MHLPDDLPQRFADFPSRKLLEKPHNRAMLANLRRKRLAEIRRVVSLVDLNNGCLEQEALLVRYPPFFDRGYGFMTPRLTARLVAAAISALTMGR